MTITAAELAHDQMEPSKHSPTGREKGPSDKLMTTPELILNLACIMLVGSVFLGILLTVTHWLPDATPAVRFILLTGILYLPALLLALAGGLPLGTAQWAVLVIATLTSLVSARLHP